jgi:peptidoglycan/xylan/chitin deacetylase (PgdA/CDA1 family)
MAAGRTLAILGYHNIGPPSPGGWETWYYIPEDIFAAQLSFLKEHGWHVLDAAGFLAGLGRPELMPERSALLTFDDGHRLLMGSALRVLRQFDYPAVFFVPTDYVGDINRYDANTREPPEALCDWDELRELERQRVSIQSHSASHPAFSELSAAQQEGELLRSKRILEEKLDKAVEIFAFPYGDGGKDPQAMGQLLRKTGYRAACLYDGGLNPFPISDAFRLHRLYLGPETDLKVEMAVS